MSRAVFVILTLTFGVTCWLAYELGILLPTKVLASDGKTTETSVEALQRSLQERERSFQNREEALNKREVSLTDKEKILASQLDRYERAIQELRAKVTDLEGRLNTRADTSRQVFEKMVPKKAAKILDEMDTANAAKILSGMHGEHAAEIMQAMAPEKARHVTEKLLGIRNIATSKPDAVKSAPKDEASPPPVMPDKPKEPSLDDQAPQKGGD